MRANKIRDARIMIIDRYIGFIGNVVAIGGPGPNFGKVQIRIVGDQGEAVIQDEDLLWAQVMMPATSAGETTGLLLLRSAPFGLRSAPR